MGDNTVRVTGYVTVQGRRARYGNNVDEITGLRPVESAVIDKITKGAPATGRDQIAFRVTFEIPVGVFDPLNADVVISVPVEMIGRHVIEAEVVPGGE